MRQQQFPKIPALLERARAAGLQWPKIRLEAEGGRRVVLALAGERSSRPGAVRVTDGRPYGTGRFFGWIERDGAWKPYDVPVEVEAALAALESDPAEVAQIQGQLTSACCFCGRRLDTAESVGVGYGPICADKFGLPWGQTAPYVERREAIVEEVLR